MIVKYKIQNAFDRERIVVAFANAGFKVHIEQVKGSFYELNYFVCVEVDANQVFEEEG
ncbi:MAG TPA: hypothetical protein PK040_00405 [Anaerolineaceae bacterium]|nr:hypothetical protein [Anaerolineaceae bacterium]